MDEDQVEDVARAARWEAVQAATAAGDHLLHAALAIAYTVEAGAPVSPRLLQQFRDAEHDYRAAVSRIGVR